MKVTKNEILFIYNSSNIQDRQALAYALSLKWQKVKTIDVQNNTLTQTQLKSIANTMDKSPEDLIDKNSTKYLRYFFNSDLSQKEILKTLQANPSMLNTPIMLKEDGGMFVDNFYQLTEKDLNFK